MKKALKKLAECLALLLFAGAAVYGVASIFNEGVVVGLSVVVTALFAVPTIVKIFKDLISNEA